MRNHTDKQLLDILPYQLGVDDCRRLYWLLGLAIDNPSKFAEASSDIRSGLTPVEKKWICVRWHPGFPADYHLGHHEPECVQC